MGKVRQGTAGFDRSVAMAWPAGVLVWHGPSHAADARHFDSTPRRRAHPRINKNKLLSELSSVGTVFCDIGCYMYLLTEG